MSDRDTAIPPLDLGRRAFARIDELASISDADGRLERLFLSAAHRRAADATARMMTEAGCDSVHRDALGNVVGRYEGATPGLPAVLIGSHLDSVRDAGKYDGPLGVVAGIGVVEALRDTAQRLPFAVEVLAFGDEENVRFPTNLASSRALAGTFDPSWLEARDRDGTRLADALVAFGGDPAGVAGLKRDRSSALAYFEMHIEQGPVLEAENLPVGIVTSIASISRATAVVTGEAGHAGTVPMRLRRDALAATAEMTLTMERLAAGHAGAVATVGELTVEPGAINVIPGRVTFTLDMRAPDDATRHALVAEIKAELAEIAAHRGVGLVVDEFFDAAACPCDPVVISALEDAATRAGMRAFRLASGAGHDAMAMAPLCPVGMLFVRCEKGISHNPLEKITLEDCDVAIRVFLNAICSFRPAR